MLSRYVLSHAEIPPHKQCVGQPSRGFILRTALIGTRAPQARDGRGNTRCPPHARPTPLSQVERSSARLPHKLARAQVYHTEVIREMRKQPLEMSAAKGIAPIVWAGGAGRWRRGMAGVGPHRRVIGGESLVWRSDYVIVGKLLYAATHTLNIWGLHLIPSQHLSKTRIRTKRMGTYLDTASLTFRNRWHSSAVWRCLPCAHKTSSSTQHVYVQGSCARSAGDVALTTE